MEDLAAQTSVGNSNAREAERRTGIPEPSVPRILHGMLDLYPYKFQALHQLLLVDTGARQNFAARVWFKRNVTHSSF